MHTVCFLVDHLGAQVEQVEQRTGHNEQPPCKLCEKRRKECCAYSTVVLLLYSTVAAICFLINIAQLISEKNVRFLLVDLYYGMFIAALFMRVYVSTPFCLAGHPPWLSPLRS